VQKKVENGSPAGKMENPATKRPAHGEAAGLNPRTKRFFFKNPAGKLKLLKMTPYLYKKVSIEVLTVYS